MQPSAPPDLQIDLAQLYELIGYLTAENAALKVARAKDQMLIQQLSASIPATPISPETPSENGHAVGMPVDIRKPGVVKPES